MSLDIFFSKWIVDVDVEKEVAPVETPPKKTVALSCQNQPLDWSGSSGELQETGGELEGN